MIPLSATVQDLPPKLETNLRRTRLYLTYAACVWLNLCVSPWDKDGEHPPPNPLACLIKGYLKFQSLLYTEFREYIQDPVEHFTEWKKSPDRAAQHKGIHSKDSFGSLRIAPCQDKSNQIESSNHRIHHSSTHCHATPLQPFYHIESHELLDSLSSSPAPLATHLYPIFFSTFRNSRFRLFSAFSAFCSHRPCCSSSSSFFFFFLLPPPPLPPAAASSSVGRYTCACSA